MAAISDVVMYLVSAAPRPDSMSVARLTKLVYLADWRAALDYQQQITSTVWQLTEFGPYVKEVEDRVRDAEVFTVERLASVSGPTQNVVRLVGTPSPALEGWEQSVLDVVVGATGEMSWAQLIDLVYSTYPVISQDRGTKLDLVVLAGHYRELKEVRRHGMP